jgi:hypothetical protein
VDIVESSKGVSGKVVVAPRLHRGQPLAEAGKRQRVVAHGADVMLALPDTPALDARARMERIDDAPPEEVARDRVAAAVGDLTSEPPARDIESAACLVLAYRDSEGDETEDGTRSEQAA